MRQATLLFRDATGTFYNDRWKPFFEGILNVILSIAFVKIFTNIGGEEFGVVGVIAATIITNLLICHVIEPYVLYKHAFCKPVKKHLFRNYCYIAVFILALLVLNPLLRTIENRFLELLVNGMISIGVSAVALFLVFLADKSVRRGLRTR